MANVLVIDDDEIMRDMLVQMLEMQGYSTIGAGDGKKGIDLLGTNKFDLVITDIIMPEKEGIETIAYMRQTFPGLPIIAISGGAKIGPESYLLIAQKIGANYTFTKPIERDAFLTAVKRCLAE